MVFLYVGQHMSESVVGTVMHSKDFLTDLSNWSRTRIGLPLTLADSLP